MQRSPLFSKTLKRVGEVKPHRFVCINGAQASDGAQTLISLGVSPPDVQEYYAATLMGSEILEAGAAFPAGSLLFPDAEGRGAPFFSFGNKAGCAALALEAATGPGDLIEVFVIQGAASRSSTVSVNGPIEPVGSLTVAALAGLDGLTLRASRPGELFRIVVAVLDNDKTDVLTAETGVTLDGTHNCATFDATGEALTLAAASDGHWRIVENTGDVVLSTV